MDARHQGRPGPRLGRGRQQVGAHPAVPVQQVALNHLHTSDCQGNSVHSLAPNHLHTGSVTNLIHSADSMLAFGPIPWPDAQELVGHKLGFILQTVHTPECSRICGVAHPAARAAPPAASQAPPVARPVPGFNWQEGDCRLKHCCMQCSHLALRQRRAIGQHQQRHLALHPAGSSRAMGLALAQQTAALQMP